MRLRIQTEPPLPILKAWFVPDAHYQQTSGAGSSAGANTMTMVHHTSSLSRGTSSTSTSASTSKSTSTIADLKKGLVSRIGALKANNYTAGDLVLLLDDFELLDEMPFVVCHAGGTGGEGVIRDGDLVVVRLKEVEEREEELPEERTQRLKRKRSQSYSFTGEGGGDVYLALTSKTKSKSKSKSKPLTHPSSSKPKPKTKTSSSKAHQKALPHASHSQKREHRRHQRTLADKDDYSSGSAQESDEDDTSSAEDSTFSSSSSSSSDESSSTTSTTSSDSDSDSDDDTSSAPDSDTDSEDSSTSSSRTSSAPLVQSSKLKSGGVNPKTMSKKTKTALVPNPYPSPMSIPHKPHHPTLSSSNLKTPTASQAPNSTPAPAPHPPSGQGHVPPGSGKPSTHARNQRRKKKRLYERGVLPALGSSTQNTLVGVEGVNAIPLGSGGSERGGGEGGGVGEEGEGVDPTQVALPASPSSSSSIDKTQVSPQKSQSRSQSQGMSRTLSGGVGVGVPASTSSSSNAPSTSTNTPVPTHPTPHPTQSSTPNLLSNPSSTSHLSNPSGTFLSPSQLAMGSFKNKNKKKGFKASMSNVIPRKVVWGSDGEEVALEALEIQGQEVQQGIQGSDEAQAQIVYVPSTPAAPPYQTPTPRSSTFASSSYSGFAATNPYPRARLVPPSEIQERGALPERMFVSCVDVEEGVWNRGGAGGGGGGGTGESKKRKKKKQRVEYEGWQDQDVDQGAGYGEGMQWEDEKEVVLNYGDEDEDAVMAGPGVEESTKTTKTPEFDWDHADEIYEKAKVVSGESQVVVGGLVGWKTLAINPQTFTPENMLTVARIVEISTPPPASSSSEPPQGSAPAPTPSTQITYKPLRRPPPPEPDYAAMFGFTSKRGLAIAAINLQDKDDEMDGQQVEEEEEQVVTWEDVVGMGWRVMH